MLLERCHEASGSSGRFQAHLNEPVESIHMSPQTDAVDGISTSARRWSAPASLPWCMHCTSVVLFLVIGVFATSRLTQSALVYTCMHALPCLSCFLLCNASDAATSMHAVALHSRFHCAVAWPCAEWHAVCRMTTRKGVVLAAGAWSGSLLGSTTGDARWPDVFKPRRGHLLELDPPAAMPPLRHGLMEMGYTQVRQIRVC